jgi:hypothetical protein
MDFMRFQLDRKRLNNDFNLLDWHSVRRAAAVICADPAASMTTVPADVSLANDALAAIARRSSLPSESRSAIALALPEGRVFLCA